MSEQTHPGVCAVYVDLLREAGAVLAVIDGDEDGDQELGALRARMSFAVLAYDMQALKSVAPTVQRLREFATDWDGSQMDDGEVPRDGLTCADLRAAADAVEGKIDKAAAWDAVLGNSNLHRARAVLSLNEFRQIIDLVADAVAKPVQAMKGVAK